MKTIKLTADTKKDLLNSLLKRSPNNYGQFEETVAEIIGKVREEGDKAVFAYTEKFDKCKIDALSILVTKEEIAEAYTKVDAALIEVMKKSAANIREFHEKQLRNSWIETKDNGSILGQRMIPIGMSGVYVPGGKAAYPSSVLMNVIPARVAGVEKIIMTTPPELMAKSMQERWWLRILQV